MTEQGNERNASPDLPDAVVRAKRSFSIVWVVPIVAILIGGWLAYKALSEKGPEITITFLTAEGLEAGKTKIKYKDVEVGQVEAITLSKDLASVVVTAELVPGAEPHLTDKTKFWVVRARVAAGEVSGLGTLFSGAYIGIEPRKDGNKTRTFKGLEIPPVVTTGLPGRHFVLQAQGLGSLDVGSPVYYRQIKVGQVVAYHLREDRTALEIEVFIHAPHHEDVYKNTRFWNAGGLDVTLDADGIQVDSESFLAMMLGGIAFALPPNADPGGPAEAGDVFTLYKNRQSISDKVYKYKGRFLLYFEGSMRGLSKGAPVEFRGIKIGEVIDLWLEYNEKEMELRIPVVIEIEPERIVSVGELTMERGERIEKLVEKGLRAQLKTGNLLTGQLLVGLDFYPDAPPAYVDFGARYPEVPTVPRPLEEITMSVAQIVDKINKLPLEEIGNGLRSTVQGTSRLVNAPELRKSIQALHETMEQTQQLAGNLNTEVASNINASLEQLQQTLAAAESVVSQDSALQYELRMTLEELQAAARAIRSMADYMDRHPEALIRGKGSSK
jgi:paraquat-inducible protein B